MKNNKTRMNQLNYGNNFKIKDEDLLKKLKINSQQPVNLNKSF